MATFRRTSRWGRCCSFRETSARTLASSSSRTSLRPRRRLRRMASESLLPGTAGWATGQVLRGSAEQGSGGRGIRLRSRAPCLRCAAASWAPAATARAETGPVPRAFGRSWPAAGTMAGGRRYLGWRVSRSSRRGCRDRSERRAASSLAVCVDLEPVWLRGRGSSQTTRSSPARPRASCEAASGASA